MSMKAFRLEIVVCGALLATAASAQTSPAPFTSATRYDLDRRVVGTIAADPDGSGPLAFAATRNTYDANGRLVRVETGQLASWQPETVPPANWTGFTIDKWVDYGYDAQDQKIRETVSTNSSTWAVTQTSYDAMDRPRCIAVRMNSSAFASTPADACALGATGNAGPDRITRNWYDVAGRLERVERAVGTSVQQDYARYTYTGRGDVRSVLDANGNLAQYEFDIFGRKTRWYFPSKTSPGAVSTSDYEEYSYDSNSNRTTVRKRDGRVLTLTYDTLNRVVSKAIPDGCAPIQVGACPPASATRDVYYGYDLRGLQTYARFDSASGEGVSNQYDAVGRAISSAINMGGIYKTITRQFDANGNRAALIHPDGTLFGYAYDRLDRLTDISLSGTSVFAHFDYNAQGQVTGNYHGTGANTTYRYDAIGRVSNIANAIGAPGGNVQFSLSYNPASQIVNRWRDNDAYAFTDYVGVNRSYAVNGLNQYTTAGSATFAYDANGNLTSDGSSNFAYDAENRLIGASGAKSASLVYDPLGRLIETSNGAGGGVTRFIYDGDELVMERSGADVLLHRYIHGNGADDPIAWVKDASSWRYYHTDAQGSIIAATSDTNTAIAVNTYDEYGIPGANNQGRFQYTGQAWIPELGVYYYKARMYSPTLGRFLQVDPIGYDDQINLYAYVANDPVNGRDPTGLDGELYWSAPGQVTYTVKYYVDTSAGGKPGFTDAGLQAQVAKDFSGSVTIKGQVVTVTAQAVAVSKPGPGVNVIKVYPTTAGVTPSGRADTNKIGGNQIRMGSTDPAVTGSHELGGHSGGAGDQYAGGVGANGKTVSADVPGAPTRMHDLGPNGANAQSLREIIAAPTNTNTCAKGVTAINGGC